MTWTWLDSAQVIGLAMFVASIWCAVRGQMIATKNKNSQEKRP